MNVTQISDKIKDYIQKNNQSHNKIKTNKDKKSQEKLIHDTNISMNENNILLDKLSN